MSHHRAQAELQVRLLRVLSRPVSKALFRTELAWLVHHSSSQAALSRRTEWCSGWEQSLRATTNLVESHHFWEEH
ncbi:MAG: hypothetical protein R3B91_08195 [Planctomycetaceae bacterium]